MQFLLFKSEFLNSQFFFKFSLFFVKFHNLSHFLLFSLTKDDGDSYGAFLLKNVIQGICCLLNYRNLSTI